MTNTHDAQAVRELAYQLWLEREPYDGNAESDWLRAEAMLSKRAQQATDQTVKESFPASDPPATHFPDEPPSNADAKWAAARSAEQGNVPPTLPGKNTPAPARRTR